MNRDILSRHFDKRCEQRLGFNLTQAQKGEIINALLGGRLLKARPTCHKHRERYYIVINYKWWELVYDSRYETLVTIYEP